MSDLNISLDRHGRDGAGELETPFVNLRRHLYGKWWHLLPDVLDAESGRTPGSTEIRLSTQRQTGRFSFSLLKSLRKKLWGSVNAAPGGTPQGL